MDCVLTSGECCNCVSRDKRIDITVGRDDRGMVVVDGSAVIGVVVGGCVVVAVGCADGCGCVFGCLTPAHGY